MVHGIFEQISNLNIAVVSEINVLAFLFVIRMFTRIYPVNFHDKLLNIDGRPFLLNDSYSSILKLQKLLGLHNLFVFISF